jgi:uncharacterized membrane protein (UPF0127 family)
MRIVVNKVSYPLEVKSTPESIKRGLAGRYSIDGGAIFIFTGDDSKTFWMRDCKIPLDIIFLTGNMVNKIHHNCQPCNTDNCERYAGNGNVVLEFGGGFCQSNNIKKGDRLDIRLE